MFCPQCGSENNLEKYCRQCGLPLATVRLAVDGHVAEAGRAINGDKKLWGYRLRVGIASLLILIGIVTILTGGKSGFSNIQSAALILIIMMVLFIQLSRKSYRVARLLDVEDQSADLNLTGSARGQLRKGANRPSDTNLPPDSITEQSTLELKTGDRIRPRRQ